MKRTATKGKPIKKCRHYNTWLVGGGTSEWCYECGAWRGLKIVGPTLSLARTTWVRPVGIGGENPWNKIKDLR